MKKKVFVTGISSEIIQNLLPLINSEEYNIVGLSRNPESIKIENAKIIKGDLRDINSFREELFNCHMVIHAAAVTHSFDKETYYNINFSCTRDLINIAIKQKVNRFILISSYVSGKKSGAYGRSKYFAERYLQENFDEWTIFRLAEIYGSNKKEGIDKLIDIAFSKSIHLCPIQIPQKLRPIYLPEVSSILKENIFGKSLSRQNVNIVVNFNYLIRDILRLIGKIKNESQYLLFIPKFIMQVIYFFTKLIPFSLGINPDQIQRLYRIDNRTEGDFEIKGKSNFVNYLENYKGRSKFY